MTPTSMIAALEVLADAAAKLDTECQELRAEVNQALRDTMTLLDRYDARLLDNMRRGLALRTQINDAIATFAALQAGEDDSEGEEWKTVQ